jgi:DNA (cytosine-5)-methyltransferase 1
LRVVDLFCGAGGFSEGFRQAGHEIVLGVDNWEPAVKTHRFNHKGSRTIIGDVVKISNLPDRLFHETIPDTEIIIGSPPCVSFSNSNRSGKAEKSEGINLILAFLRIIARKKWKSGTVLKYWIMENVPNSANYIKDLYSASELGLEGEEILLVKNSCSRVYNASYYGVPSRRKRYLCGEFPEPVPTNGKESKIPLSAVLSALGEPCEKEKQQILDPLYELSIPGKQLTDHHYLYPLAKHQWQKARRLKLDKGYMGKMSFPEDINKPARTIMATMTFSARESMIFANKSSGYRAPTIREVATLMSFPITYIFFGNTISQKYRLVGNAVPPRMSYALGSAIWLESTGYMAEKPTLNNYFPDSDFVNLNGQTFEIVKEKRKIKNSKFKYHVPYLIIDRYRVELTNHQSDFEKGIYSWNVEVRRAQGPQAETFVLDVDDKLLSQQEAKKINEWIACWIDKNPIDSQTFQENYTLPDEIRASLRISGPYELLNNIRTFIDEQNYSKEEQVFISTNPKTLMIPKAIFVAYFTLAKTVSIICGRQNNEH